MINKLLNKNIELEYAIQDALKKNLFCIVKELKKQQREINKKLYEEEFSLKIKGEKNENRN